jgi:predicted secreted hydrolase
LAFVLAVGSARVRGAVVILALVAVLALPAASAAAPPRVMFPRDHYGHSQASIEWWYFTALAKDESGTPYTVFFTLFSSQGGLVPVSQVVNLASGVVVGHSEDIAVGKVGASSFDLKAGDARLRYKLASNTWSFAVASADFAVSLTQRPLKPYALHGLGTGLINQSYAGPSHYYSSTRMAATGTLRTGAQTIALTGQSWFDHQWGSFGNDPRAFNWNWFSCRFDNGTELMLYQFLDRTTGQPLTAFKNGTFVAKNGKTTHITDFAATAGTRTLDAAGRNWPLDWTLNVPSLSLSETVRAIVPDQLVRNTLLPTFWEGASRATGSRGGTCFVELSYR